MMLEYWLCSSRIPPYSSEREDFSWIALPKDDGTNWWSIVDEQQKVG